MGDRGTRWQCNVHGKELVSTLERFGILYDRCVGGVGWRLADLLLIIVLVVVVLLVLLMVVLLLFLVVVMMVVLLLVVVMLLMVLLLLVVVLLMVLLVVVVVVLLLLVVVLLMVLLVVVVVLRNVGIVVVASGLALGIAVRALDERTLPVGNTLGLRLGSIESRLDTDGIDRHGTGLTSALLDLLEAFGLLLGGVCASESAEW